MSTLEADLTTSAPAAAPKRIRARVADHRILGQPAFVLHSYPYKETSLIVELFARDFGRLRLVAQGPKPPHPGLPPSRPGQPGRATPRARIP